MPSPAKTCLKINWRLLTALLIFASLAGLPSYAQDGKVLPLRLVDDQGHVFLLAHRAKRIISLSPAITELVFAAGAGEKLVGVSRFSDYPAAALSIPSVGDAFSLDLERLLMLEPDLVIAWRSGNTKLGIDQLERLGLRIFVTEATQLADIPRLLRTIGKLAGTLQAAESAAQNFEMALQRLKQQQATHEPVSVFQLIWPQPLITVGAAHIINDIINVCGGTNIFASLPDLMPIISEENLLAANPAVIFSSISDELLASSTYGFFQRFPHISAVKKGHVYFIHPDLIHRQSPRILEATRRVCARLDAMRAQ